MNAQSNSSPLILITVRVFVANPVNLEQSSAMFHIQCSTPLSSSEMRRHISLSVWCRWVNICGQHISQLVRLSQRLRIFFQGDWKRQVPHCDREGGGLFLGVVFLKIIGVCSRTRLLSFKGLSVWGHVQLFWTTSPIDIFKPNIGLHMKSREGDTALFFLTQRSVLVVVVVFGKMASNVEAPESWYLALLGFAEHFRTSSPPKIRLCVHCLQAVFQFKPPQRVEARTHLQLGSVLYHHTKNSELARSHLEKAVRRESLRKLDDGVRDALIGVSYSQMGKVVLLALDPDPFII